VRVATGDFALTDAIFTAQSLKLKGTEVDSQLLCE
jgi:hypothetical protein